MTERSRHRTSIAVFILIVVAATAGLLGQEKPDRSSGAYLYRVFCTACHGDDGKGKGAAAATLRQAVPDLSLLSRDAGGIFPRERVLKSVENGGPTGVHVPGSMPSWGEAFARLEPGKGTAEKWTQALVDHIESLQAQE